MKRLEAAGSASVASCASACAKAPKRTIVGFFVVVFGICGPGFATMKTVTKGDLLWVDQNSIRE